MGDMTSLLLALAQGKTTAPACGIDNWMPFHWSDRDKSALFVPAMVNSKETQLQLDTGSDTTFLYGGRVAWIFGTVPAAPSPESDDVWHQVDAFSFDGRPPQPQQMMMLEGMRGSRRLAGTIGSDVLIGKILVLDYQRERFAVLDEAQLSTLSGQVDANNADIRRNKLFISIESQGQVYPDVFSDTGSSKLDLWVDEPLWRTLTGLSEPMADGPVISGQSWGVRFQYHGAPVPDLSIAGQSVAGAVTYFPRRSARLRELSAPGCWADGEPAVSGSDGGGRLRRQPQLRVPALQVGDCLSTRLATAGTVHA